MQKDIIYLIIAGFSIKITFYKSDYIIKGIFINQITQSYKEFIKKKINGLDFSIDFVDSELPNTTVKNRYGYYFGLLYKKISSRKILSFYHIGLFNFQFLLKYSLYHIMAKCKNAFVFHASANLVNNRVYIFIGDSGSGKSTVMRLLNDVYPAVADDSIFVKKEGGKYYFYQTPFFEKEYWIKRSPKQYSIGGLFFLKKACVNKIEAITNAKEIFRNLSRHLIINDTKTKPRKSFFSDFIRNCNRYNYFYFKKSKKRLIKFIETTETIY